MWLVARQRGKCQQARKHCSINRKVKQILLKIKDSKLSHMVFVISEICCILILNNNYTILNKYKRPDKLKFSFGKPIHLFPYHWLVNDDATLSKPPIRIEIHFLWKIMWSSVSFVVFYVHHINVITVHNLFIYFSIS
jgi:hypothetical protein